MISIGAVYNGPELKDSRINQSLRAAAKAIDEIRGPLNLGRVPLVNAVFLVAGSMGPPGISHLEYGKFSAKDKAIVVQIPVTDLVVNSNDHSIFIIDSLRGANAMAFEFFRQKGEDFLLREAEALVTAVEQRLCALR